VATLEAYDGTCPICEQIDYLAFAFVTPLGTDDDDVSRFHHQ
jgi:hypothetical protein